MTMACRGSSGASKGSGILSLIIIAALAGSAFAESSAVNPLDPGAAAEQSLYIAAVRAKRTRATCWPSDLPPSEVERIMRENGFLPPGMFAPVDERFWTDTLVWTGDGLQGPSARAARTRLTYSFPADGTTWGLASISSTGPNTLNASFNTLFTAANNDRGRELVRQSLASWHKYCGLDYDEVADDGTAMSTSSARVATRGDIRIGGRGFGTTTFLAYNGFPSATGVFGAQGGGGGDMCINTSFFLAANFNDSTNNYRYFRNTVAHEHGHGTGNIHATPCNNTKLMEPQISLGFDVVQTDDRRGGGKNYGDRFAGNQSVGTAINAGDLTSQSYIARALSTNGSAGANNTNQDWFTFTLTSPQTVTITVSPVGGTYSAGQQVSGCSGSSASIASSLAGNLNVSLRDSTGATNLVPGQGNTAAAGAIETINAGTLSAGTYSIQIIDVGPNSAANQTVQLYDLVIRSGSTQAPPWAVAGINKRVAANTNCWFMGNINSQVTETGATIPNPGGYDWDSDGDGTIDTNDQAQFNRTYPSNGVYPVTLRLTDSNGRVGTDTINVTVFGATASISSVGPANGNQGDVVPVTISGVNFKGVTTASQFTVSGSGVTVTGTPVVNALGTQVSGLSFNIAPGAATGMRSLSVTNSDGSGSASGNATLALAFLIQTPPSPPGPFNLTSPADGATNQSVTPTLVWDAAPLAATYDLTVATDSGLTLPVAIQTGLAGTSFAVPPATLNAGQTYFWGVTAVNANGGTASSPFAASFTTTPPACSGDINGDGQRNTADLTVLLQNFGLNVTPNTGGDLDGNGTVNTADLTGLLQVFGIPC